MFANDDLPVLVLLLSSRTLTQHTQSLLLLYSSPWKPELLTVMLQCITYITNTFFLYTQTDSKTEITIYLLHSVVCEDVSWRTSIFCEFEPYLWQNICIFFMLCRLIKVNKYAKGTAISVIGLLIQLRVKYHFELKYTLF